MPTRRLLIAAFALTATPALAAAPVYAPDGDPGLSPRAQGMVRSLRAVIKAKQAELAALPPPTPAERLVRMAALEQSAREALYGLDVDSLDFDQRRATLNAAWSLVEGIDRKNQAGLKALLRNDLPDGDWFRRTVWGEDAARAAWLITVHAVNDRALMREAADRMSALVADAG